MCDYSLHNVRSRPAKVGDKLTTRSFGTGTRGFAASEDASVVVCVLPGTELSFAGEVSCSLLPWRARVIKHKTAGLSANQQRLGVGPSRCAGISRWPDRAPNTPVQRSAGYGSSVTGGAKD